MSSHIQSCSICGATEFVSKPVLWDGLIHDWNLSSAEAAYIDRQQGTHCARCGGNLRSIALARAILSAFGYKGRFQRFLRSPRAWLLRTLELNGAGSLTTLLGRLPRLTRSSFPDVDMQALPYAEGSFDLVLHSDTLEHVPDPLKGLSECCRVLRPGGWCCFTVPMVTGRSSRRRDGLPPSYHQSENTRSPDFLVHTEYGSDCWEQVLSAGFDECRIVTAEFPSAQAFAARKPL